MVKIKRITTPNEQSDYSPKIPNKWWLDFVDELLKVLQNNSREAKNQMMQIKKDANASENRWPKEKEEIDKRIWQVIKWSPEAETVVAIPEIIDGLKYFWRWQYEEAKLRIWVDENDEHAKKTCGRFVEYAWPFNALYQKVWTDYLRAHKKIPNYRTLLKVCFCRHIKRYMEMYLRNMKFSEEECKESFWMLQEELSEKWFELEASDNIKESFIKLCREKYPLAKKSCDFLFESKSFKKDYLEMIIKSLDPQLSTMYDDIVHDTDEEIKRRAEIEEIPEDMIAAIEPVITMLDLAWEINSLLDEGTRDDAAITLYFVCIANSFEVDHNKKLKKQNISKEQTAKKKNESPSIDGLISDVNRESWRTYLSEEENELVKQAVSYLNLGEKEWSVIKYITKLKMKDLPIKFHDFKRLFDIKEIPPQTEAILIDKLGLEYEVEEEALKVKEEEKIIEEKKPEQEIAEEIEIEDPTQYFIDKMKSFGYIIDTEWTLRKQIEDFSQNDNYRTVFINLLKNPTFWKEFLHKWGHSAARVIRIGRTGWRILFEIKKDNKLHLLCFANHNYYLDRLAKTKNRKKG